MSTTVATKSFIETQFPVSKLSKESYNLSLRSQGTHRRAQDGKTRKTRGIFSYAAMQHRYTHTEKSLDIAL
jgi:hypothetical protein